MGQVCLTRAMNAVNCETCALLLLATPLCMLVLELNVGKGRQIHKLIGYCPGMYCSRLCLFVCLCVCMCVRACMRAYVRACACVCVCVCACACACMCVHACAWYWCTVNVLCSLEL